MGRTIFLSAVIGIIGNRSMAQDTGAIQTDRPDQTESPYVVPRGMVQVEVGSAYEEAVPSVSDWVHPTSLIKYGVNDKFELRLITDLGTEKTGGESSTGLRPVTIGFKSVLGEERGILPKISFIGHLTLPNVASAGQKSTYYANSYRFLCQHTLSNKVNISYNFGAEWDGITAIPTFIYTLSTGISISEKMGSFIEVYCFAPQTSTADHLADAGLTYLITNNVQLDASGGIGLTDNSPNYFISAGLSFRFNTKQKVQG